MQTTTNLTHVLMGELLDAARTMKFQRAPVDCSAPYEKLEIASLRPAQRRRAATVPRALLAQKRAARNSAPYAAIEIELEPPHSLDPVASGTLEAAWFAAPEDEIGESAAPARQTDGARWMMLGGAILGACALVISLLALV